jgi:hypothetical protein
MEKAAHTGDANGRHAICFTYSSLIPGDGEGAKNQATDQAALNARTGSYRTALAQGGLLTDFF